METKSNILKNLRIVKLKKNQKNSNKKNKNQI